MIFADTHVLIWLASGDPRLPLPAGEVIASGEEMAVSAVTAFEYADLQRRGRLPAAPTVAELAASLCFQVLDFPALAYELVSALPPIHGDPIDRMLIAHVKLNDAILATADQNMRKYPVRMLW